MDRATRILLHRAVYAFWTGNIKLAHQLGRAAGHLYWRDMGGTDHTWAEFDTWATSVGF